MTPQPRTDTDGLFVMGLPKILIDKTRAIPTSYAVPGSGVAASSLNLTLFDFEQFSACLFYLDHVSLFPVQLFSCPRLWSEL